MDYATEQKLELLFKSKLHGVMRMYLDTCARCGLCVESCHVYASMPETKYTAVGRAEVVRKIFKRYFKLEGKIAPWLGEVLEFTDDTMERLNEAAFSCTGCRRCMMHCPFGIDTQQIMSIAKALLIGADKEPKILSMLADMSIAKADGLDETRSSYAEALANLDSEVRALWPASPVPAVPYEKSAADVLYVPLAGSHSIVSAAAIMNAAGENWTLSSFEAVNFGTFLGDARRASAISTRIVDEAKRLGVKEVAVVECGTAFRVLKQQIGEQPFRVSAFVELIDRYLEDGRIKVDKSMHKELTTYHDPCQIARNVGVIEQPRRVLRAVTDYFTEMTPNKAESWCCGGGGGLVAMGELEFRMKSSKVKANQLKATGARVVTTACENCHSQLSDLNEYYGLGMKVEFLSHLVARVLVKRS
ncbi:MAG TPA: (Fe-S)-binding protein [bacterium]|nr:(Fe-S)-binding protein [bacterium]